MKLIGFLQKDFNYIYYAIIFVSLKILTLLFIFFNFSIFFDQSVFKFNDFNGYLNSSILGPNAAFSFLIKSFGYDSISNPVFVFLALFFNFLIDLLWILFFLDYFRGFKYFIVFCLIFAIHPYYSLYYFKFTSIIFMKIALVFSFVLYRWESLRPPIIYFVFAAVIICLFRNSSVFILIPAIFVLYHDRVNFFVLIVCSVFLSVVVLFSSGDYLSSVINSSQNYYPWNYDYISNLVGSSFSFIIYPCIIIIKSILFFGARELLYTSGVEAFLPGFEVQLLFYFVFGVINLFGFIFFIFFRFDLRLLLICIVPIILSIISISHMRYSLPFVPLTVAGMYSFLHYLSGRMIR
jgi:hypothetical protein